MLIANPQPNKEMGLKYILSFLIDGEPQTEMGEVSKLPIWIYRDFILLTIKDTKPKRVR